MYYDTLESFISKICINNNDCTVRADINISTNKDAHKYTRNSWDSIEGNVLEVDINKDDSEIEANVEVTRKRKVRLWGQVKDSTGEYVKCVLVNLIKQTYKNNKIEFESIAHTVTDCMGFYQFDISPPKYKEHFFIMISKQIVDKKRTIDKSQYNSRKIRCEYIKY